MSSKDILRSIHRRRQAEPTPASDRSSQWQDGHRNAIRWAVTWLHKRANEMNDPIAKAILDAAAINMGADAKRF